MSRWAGIDIGNSIARIAIFNQEYAAQPKVIECSSQLTWSLDASTGLMFETQSAGGCNTNNTIAMMNVLGASYKGSTSQDTSMGQSVPLVASTNGDARFSIEGQVISPLELCANVFRGLKDRLKSEEGVTVTDAVVSVPPYYTTTQREMIYDAALVGGVNVRSLISTPVAVLLGLKEELRTPGYSLVCDAGASSFGVSLVDTTGEVIRVVDVWRDEDLSGDAMDRLIFNAVSEEIRARFSVDIRSDRESCHRLFRAIHDLKLELSFSETANLELLNIGRKRRGRSPVNYRRRFSKHEFEGMLQPLLLAMRNACHRMLQRHDVSDDALQQVFLVGGLAKLPALYRNIQKQFSERLIAIDNPHHSVVSGASVYATSLQNQNTERVGLERASSFIGMRVESSGYTLMISKGTYLPVRDFKLVSTTVNEQESVNVDIYEGETTNLFENRFLSRYTIYDLPKEPAGRVVISFELTCDHHGRISVRASDPVTKESYPLRRVARAGMSRDEVFELVQQYDEAASQ